MSTSPALTAGIVGFGEVGSSIAQGLRSDGLESILVFDKFNDGPFGPLMDRRAREAGVTIARNRAELSAADVVICCVTVADALDAALETAPMLKPGAIFVDVNSTGPKAKKMTAAAVADTTVRFVDGTVMSSPSVELHRVPILASGAAAPEFRDLMNPHGMNIRVVGTEPGTAASIKIVRSVLTKGLEVLFVEALLAARRYGIDKEVLGSFAEFMDARPTTKTAEMLVTTHVIHAHRRGLELEMSAETLADVGVEPVMAQAIREIYRRTAAMGLKEKFAGQAPATLDEALTAIESGPDTR